MDFDTVYRMGYAKGYGYLLEGWDFTTDGISAYTSAWMMGHIDGAGDREIDGDYQFHPGTLFDDFSGIVVPLGMIVAWQDDPNSSLGYYVHDPKRILKGNHYQSVEAPKYISSKWKWTYLPAL